MGAVLSTAASDVSTQHFFADGRYLGSRTIPSYRQVPGLEVRYHYSQVLFCAFCGELWGRLLHDGARLTQCVHRPCLKHGDGRLACYPTWTDDPTRFEDDWPDEAVEYEFQATLAFAERTQP